jgi:hypothetical protein
MRYTGFAHIFQNSIYRKALLDKLLPNLSEVSLGFSSSVKVEHVVIAMVRPLVHFREIRASLGVRISRTAHASDVTYTSLGVKIAFGEPCKFTESG